MNDDEMENEYDLSHAQRGRHYRPGAVIRLPIYLNPDLQARLLAAAERQRITLDALVNDVLARELAIADNLK